MFSYFLGLTIMAILTFTIAFTQSIPLLYLLNSLRAFGNGLIVIAFTTILQSYAETQKLGRVFSTMGFLSEALRPVSILVGSYLAASWGNSEAIAISSGFFLLAALLSLAGFKYVKPIEPPA